MSMEFHAESADGITSPYGTPAQAAYALTPGTAESFVCGAAKIDSVVVKGVQSATIDFGLSLSKNWADGDPYPTWCGIAGRRPMITIQTLDATVLRTLGIGGHSISSSATFYLRKIAKGSTRVADATEEHISFTAHGGLAVVRALTARHGQQIEPAGAEIVIMPHLVSPNPILTIDTAAAISFS